MGLNDFVVKEERPLPVFILADVSGSMEGEKIQVLNNALREMITSLTKMDDVRGVFQVGIITFGDVAKIHQPLTKVDSIVLNEMTAKGKTSMGEAFDLVTQIIEDKKTISSRAYAPTIVLVSDGKPTDFKANSKATIDEYLNWGAIKQLHKQESRVSKCLRLAMGIGTDSEINMLKAFVNNPNVPIIQSKDAVGISDFFKWVTMSTVSRINSADPNDPMSMLPIRIEKDEIII